MQSHFVDNILKRACALFFTHRYQILLYNSHNLTSIICLYTVCSIWPIDRSLSGTTTTGQSGPRSNANTPHFPNLQGWSLTIRWLNGISRTLVDGVRLSKDGVVYSTAPADWALTTPYQSGSGSNANTSHFQNLQGRSLTTRWLNGISRTLVRGFCLSAKMESCILQPQQTRLLSLRIKVELGVIAMKWYPDLRRNYFYSIIIICLHSNMVLNKILITLSKQL